MSIHPIAGLLSIGFLSLSEGAEFTLTEDKIQIQSPAITEASGLAISQQNEHFLWTLNDSGNPPELHLLNTDGADRGKLMVSNATNIDWEDIASFALDGKSYLLIADTGDNNATRKSCTVYILPEPQLPAHGQKLSGAVAAEWHIDFTYAGGPRDCESVAVDSVSKKIILISKRTRPPEVYELPLRASNDKGVVILTKIGETSVQAPTGNFLPFANQPTGLDISADRSLAAVVTYHGVFIFHRKPAESWAEAFAQKPTSLGPHNLPQAESVAFSKDGKSIYVTTEGKNPRIRRYGR